MAKSLTLSFTLFLVLAYARTETALSQKGPQLSFRSRTPVSIGSLGLPIHAVSHVVPLRERLVVLETETNALRVLSTDGKVLSVKANTGPQGAMLQRAARAASTSTEDLLVLDVQRPRIARFRLKEEQLALVGVVDLPEFARVSSLCSAGGRTFVLGATKRGPSNLVQVVNQDGSVSSGFGLPFGRPNASENVRTALGSGVLTCLASERLVVVASALSAEIRAYSLDGILKWTSTLTGFAPIAFQDVGNGIKYSYPLEGHWDSVSDTFALQDGVIGVQVARREKQSSTPSSFRTFFLDSNSGSIRGAQFDLPQVVGSWRGGLVALDGNGLWILTR